MNFTSIFREYLTREVAGGEATSDTVRTYEGQCALYLRWCEGESLAPLAATRTDIERYRDNLKEAGASASTRCLKLSVVKSFYDALVWAGHLEQNPARAVRARRGSRGENTKALATGELVTLFDVVKGDSLKVKRDRLVVAVMALHGLRSIEAHRLDHEDLRRDEAGAYLQVLGKGNKPRQVYLRPDTLTVLQAYVDAKTEADLNPTGALLVSLAARSYGKRLSRHGLQMLVNQYLKEAGLKAAGISCHALRHTFGTLSVAGGARIEQLRDAMGHSSVATTSIYVRAFERAEQNPAKFINVEVTS